MKILGLSAHTDDIELAAGGKLVKHLAAGDEIKIVVFSYCQESLPDIFFRDELKREFISSMREAGIKDYEVLNFQVRNFYRARQEILEKLIEIRLNFKPDLIITHSENDLHQDHQVVALESIRAFKNSASILAMQMPHNNLRFVNGYYERLSRAQMMLKIKMLRHYVSQVYLERKIFEERLIWSWAMVNGFCCNAEYAECFEVVRWIA